MNTKRRLCLALVSLMLCVALVIGVAACDPETPADIPSAETENGLFTNGTFGSTTGNTYPLTPTNWTGSRGSSSGSNATPSGSDNLIAGVISVDPDVYSDNRGTYGNVANPSKPEGVEDDNILMLYNKVPTVYKYTSASVSLATSSYYKLTVWVYTDIDDEAEDFTDKSGAYIYVNGAAYAAFKAIDTEREWTQYTVYIETSDISSQSITVVLSLGDGNLSGGALTQGYAYFDDVKLENLSDVEDGEEEFTAEDFAAITADDTTAKYTMKVSDGEFDYSTTTSAPYTASKWTGVAGRGDGDNAPSSSTYASKGIIDSTVTTSVEAADGTDVQVTVAPGTVGTKMLMINNRRATAYGYRSSAAMRLMGGNDSYYKVSVKVRTANIVGNGVTVALTDGSNTSVPYFEKGNIVTNGEWSTIEIFVAANQFRSTDVYLELWLGRGGADNTDTHVTGVAFFDGVTLQTIDKATYDDAADEENTVSFLTDEDELDRDSLTVGSFSVADNDNLIADRTNWQTVDTSVAEGETWTAPELFPGLENPGAPVPAWDSSVLVINNYKPSSFSLSTVGEDTNATYTIERNRCYIISVWVKTQDFPSGSGVTLALFSYDESAKEDERKTQLSSFTSINTEDLEDYRSEGNNDYTEFRFVIKGANDGPTQVGLDIGFGSGTAMSPTTMLSGYAFVSTITIEPIEYSEYSSVSTSTVVKSVSLLGSSGSAELSSNGYFEFIDVAATQSAYADVAAEEGKTVFGDNGDLVDYLGVPDGWTINKSSALTDGQTVAGVLDLGNSAQLDSSNITGAFDTIDPDLFYDSIGIVGADTDTYPNVLAVRSADYVTYESDSVSLSASSYYLLGIWAKTDGKSTITVSLDASTDSAEMTTFAPTDSNWHFYAFYVRTGFTSVDVTMTVGVGTSSSSGSFNTAYFAIANYAAITESAFDAAQSADTETDYNTVKSFVIDSFDSSSDLAEISAPDNWTGATVDEDASTADDDFVGGIFNQREGDWSLLGIDPDSAEQSAIANKLEASTKLGDSVLGDNVLVINNKIDGAYAFTSDSVTLEGDTYYKVSIWVLTYGLDQDETATLSLKLNNLSYTFGRQNNVDDNDADRKINTSTYSEDGAETVGDWKCYTFYLHTEEGVTPAATMTAQLGFDGAMIDGYAFFDNFSIDKITEEEFTAATGEDMAVGNNWSITFTQEDADAEEEPEETDPTEEPTGSDLIWVWITTGVIGVILLVVVIVVLVKKYTHSRKFTTRKKPTAPVNRSNDRRSDNNSGGDKR